MFNKKIISNNIDRLTKQEKIVANYAMDKGFEVVNISINKMVIDTKTSLATISRTFSKLGFTGLKNYKMFLFSRINNKIEKNDEFNFQRNHLLLSLENTLSSLDTTNINKISQILIKNSQKILILGEGFSHFIAKIFQSKLMKIFFDAKIFDENLYNSVLNSNVLVIFSVNMNNKSLTKKLQIIKNINKNLKVIVFTTNPNIKNDYYYDYVLSGALVDSYRMNSHELPSDSLILLIALSNIVFDSIYMKNEDEYKKIIHKIKW